jgi:uncharacterized protein
MRVSRYQDVEEFARRAMPMLLREEAVNNWTVGFLSDVVNGTRKVAEESLLMCGVEDDRGEMLAAGLSTGESLVLTRMGGDAIGALVQFLVGEKIELPKTSGPAETVREFANAWASQLGLGLQIRLKMQLRQLERVNRPVGIGGELRLAGMELLDVLETWGDGFRRELKMEAGQIREDVRARIERTRLWVWCDPEAVSMAALAGPTPNGVRVNFVYTPVENRRCGYARACVAELSQKMLDEGKRFVFLYVDAENQSTMRMYREIGYQPVCDWEDWKFLKVIRTERIDNFTDCNLNR